MYETEIVCRPGGAGVHRRRAYILEVGSRFPVAVLLRRIAYVTS